MMSIQTSKYALDLDAILYPEMSGAKVEHTTCFCACFNVMYPRSGVYMRERSTYRTVLYLYFNPRKEFNMVVHANQ